MDFKDFLTEEEKKVEKLAVCFIKDTEAKEVYTVLAPKSQCESVVGDFDRYDFIAGSEGVKLTSKGYKAALFDLSRLKKHVFSETSKPKEEEK
jgi:hypothetical protein